MGIHYEVEPVSPEAHLFRVTMTIPAPTPSGQVLRLPAWIPGSYMIREFARHVVAIRAEGPTGPVALTKRDKDTWVAAPCDGPLVITSDVYAWDLSVRAAHLDATHGFFNGTSLLLCAEGHEHGRHTLTLVPGDHPAVAGWKVATSLRQLDGEPWGWGTFEARDYDELVDHPVELGTWRRWSFTAAGVPHDVVITGRGAVDGERLVADLRPLCEAEIALFGAPAPFDRYLFLVMAVGDGYGGLEHRSSTALVCKRADLPQPGMVGTPDGYRSFLGLCSHEYFHSWNVKRIKPRAFVPYDLAREGHTRLLWAFEGFTSYYDDLLLLRSGRIDVASWAELLGRTATSVWRWPGRHVQDLEHASFDAWTRYYRQDENSPNALVSYYTKGALAGLCFDLALRRATGGRHGLDEVMRRLWARFGDGSGVPEDGVEAIILEVGGPSLAPLVDDALRGTRDLPLGELVGDLGLVMHVRAASGPTDRGGAPGVVPEGGVFGVKAEESPRGARLKHCLAGGAAMRAGLSAGDVVVAVDHLAVGAKEVGGVWPTGRALTVHAFRRDELFEVTLTPAAPPLDTVWFEVLPDNPSASWSARRAAWRAGVDEG